MAMTANDVLAAEVDRLAVGSGATAAEIREAIGVAMPVTARKVERLGSLHRSCTFPVSSHLPSPLLKQPLYGVERGGGFLVFPHSTNPALVQSPVEAVSVVDAVLLLLRLRHDHLEGGLKGGGGVEKRLYSLDHGGAPTLGEKTRAKPFPAKGNPVRNQGNFVRRSTLVSCVAFEELFSASYRKAVSS